MAVYLAKVSSSAHGINKNITSFNKTISSQSNVINSSFSKGISDFSNASSKTLNVINLTSANLIANEQSAFGSINQNVTSNKNSIEGLSNLFSGQNSNVTETKATVDGMQSNITLVLELARKILNNTNNITFTSNTEINSIRIKPFNQSINPNAYVFGSLLSGFDNHLVFNATEPITISVFSLSQYNLGNNQMSYNQWCQTSSNNAQNSINFWFNYSQQSSTNYVYVIYSQNVSKGFNIQSNTIAVYNSTLINRENC